MKFYDILWVDGNGPEWEYTESWYAGWYKPHTCPVCSSRSLDLRFDIKIELAAKSIPKTKNMIDIVGNRVALTIVQTDLYRAIQEPFDRSFHVGPVIINGEPDPTHVACIAKYEARVLFEGSIATEGFNPCPECGRFFQNIIGRRFVRKANLPKLDVISDCAGLALIASEKIFQVIPQHVIDKCHFRRIDVKD